MKEYKWAVLGCGVIANQMGQAFAKAGRHLYAVGNRTQAKAEAFAKTYGVDKVYTDFHDMFRDPEVDIIYLTTPHNTHIQYLREALAAGKHVLCEKSITLNADELQEAKKLAEQHGAVLAEAQTIFHMPLYRELERRKEAGEFGRVNVITMNFGSFKEYDAPNRFFSREKAGGAMLDIGVYALSCARIFLDSAPDTFETMMLPASTGVDMTSVTILRNAQNQMMTMALSLHSKQPKRAMISCDKAYIEIMEYPRSARAVITWTETGEQTIVEAGRTEDALLYEMQDMERAVAGDDHIMRFTYTEEVMDLMTRIRGAWGFTYPEEEQA